MDYYEKLMAVGAAIAVLATVHIILVLNFEVKCRRKRDERSRQDKT